MILVYCVKLLYNWDPISCTVQDRQLSVRVIFCKKWKTKPGICVCASPHWIIPCFTLPPLRVFNECGYPTIDLLLSDRKPLPRQINQVQTTIQGSNRSPTRCNYFCSLLSWSLFTVQHVSSVLTSIIRSSTTAVAAFGFTVGAWW
jgi:hypothetical protein